MLLSLEEWEGLQSNAGAVDAELYILAKQATENRDITTRISRMQDRLKTQRWKPYSGVMPQRTAVNQEEEKDSVCTGTAEVHFRADYVPIFTPGLHELTYEVEEQKKLGQTKKP